VPQHDAGDRFHLHVPQGGALLQGKVADLLLRETNVIDDLLRQRAHALCNFAFGKAEGGGRPFVESFRALSDGGFSARGYFREDSFNSLPNLRVVFSLRFGGLARLDMTDHDVLPKLSPSSIRRSLVDARPAAMLSRVPHLRESQNTAPMLARLRTRMHAFGWSLFRLQPLRRHPLAGPGRIVWNAPPTPGNYLALSRGRQESLWRVHGFCLEVARAVPRGRVYQP
jgi:hypothetical protein